MKETLELKELSNKLSYLKEVINKAEDTSKLDKNIIYEIVYSHMLLENYISDGIADNIVSIEAKSLLNSFKLLVDSIPSELADEALKTDKISNTAKIDKIKYAANSNGFRGTYDKKAYSYNIPTEAYIKSKLASLVMLVVLMGLIALGIPEKIIDLTINMSSSISEGLSVTSEENVSSINNENTSQPKEDNVSDVFNKEVVASTDELLKTIKPILSSILTIGLALVMMLSLISITLDVAYLSLPPIRKMFEILKLPVSKDAINACSKQSNGDIISYVKIKEPDRIKRNLAILNIMMEQYPNNNILKEIKSIVNSNWKGKEYYYTIAKIEFLYDKLLSTGEVVNHI